jgi:hypothetical protein
MKLTGAANLVSRGVKVLKAAPVSFIPAEAWNCSPNPFCLTSPQNYPMFVQECLQR